MLDIKFVRENPEIVKQNIRNKFQDKKLVLVDEVLELDKRNREIKAEVEALRANRNKVSKEIGKLMGQGKREEAMAIKEEIAKQGARVDELTEEEKKVEEELKKKMMVIPNIIDPSVPIGKSSLRCYLLRKRFHDRPRIYILCTAFHDPQQCCHGRYVLRRDGRHDVQDRGRGSLPYRNI